MPTRVEFKPLQPVIVRNPDDAENAPVQKRMCGVTTKIIIIAVLVALLLLVVTAIIVLIVLVSRGDPSASPVIDPAEEATAATISVPASQRLECPVKEPGNCVKAGCLYSTTDLQGNALSSSIPRCFYPIPTFSLSSGSDISNMTGYTTVSSELREITATLDDSEKDSVSITISGSGLKRKRRRRGVGSPAIYSIEYHDTFGFQVTRSNERVFSLEETRRLNVLDQFVSVSLAIPKNSKAIGLGNFSQLSKKFDNSKFTMWSRSDEEGAHPFVLLISDSGMASGVYVDSSYPVQVSLESDYRVTALVLNNNSPVTLRMFLGPSPSDVIRQYWAIVGSPSRPPYYGLGHFVGSESVTGYEELVAFVKNQTDTDIPVEGSILPLSMNEDCQPFTYNAKISAYLKTLSSNGSKMISTVAPGITSKQSSTGSVWSMYKKGTDNKVWIYKDKNRTQLLEGLLNDMVVVYPDFTSSNSFSWWYTNITASGLNSEFGFHLQKNMPWSELNGAVGTCDQIAGNIDITKDILQLDDLEANTLCVSAYSSDGMQLELHNKFALQQATKTRKTLLPYPALANPLLVSDATSPGIGQHAGHLHDSSPNSKEGRVAALSEITTFSLLGVPLTGINLCTKDTIDSDDCLLWYYLSVVSPLCWSTATETAHIFAGDETFQKNVKTVIEFRQQLLPYHYDAQYKASADSEPPLRPLIFDYPSDSKAILYTDQVLFGDSILYAPRVREDEESRVAYLPAGYWCAFSNGNCYTGPTEVAVSEGSEPASFVFMKGGSVLLTQGSAATTILARKEKFGLIVVVGKEGTANSTRYLDDGQSSNSVTQGYYTLINYAVANNTMTVSFTKYGYKEGLMTLKYGSVHIYGFTAKVGDVTVTRSGSTDKESVKSNCILADDGVTYKLVIRENSVDIALKEEFTLSWSDT